VLSPLTFWVWAHSYSFWWSSYVCCSQGVSILRNVIRRYLRYNLTTTALYIAPAAAAAAAAALYRYQDDGALKPRSHRPDRAELNSTAVIRSMYLPLLHFAWVVDDAKCIVVTRVCVSICLSAAACLHYCTDPDVTWGSGRGCPLVVHYWADLQ